MQAFRVSTDRDALDVALIHRFLSTQSTWARGIGIDLVRRSLDHSLCFGGYLGVEQVAFARVVTDRATFANLVDVFVLPAHRGRGYSVELMAAVMAHPDLQGLRRWALNTLDAHDRYRSFGWRSPAHPGRLMERMGVLSYPVPA